MRTHTTSLRTLTALSFLVLLCTCQSSSDVSNGVTEIRTQSDADAYNALVTNEADKLICRRERIMNSVRSRLVCMTAAQWDSLEEQMTDIRGRGAILGQ